jgi:integrase
MKPRNFYQLILAFQGSDKYERLAESTKEGYGYVLRLAGNPNILGALQVGAIRPAHVQSFLDGLSRKPAIQLRALVALRSIETWAIGPRDLLRQPITTGCEIIGCKGAREPWTYNNIRLAESVCRSDIARLVTLAANTGQRGSDLVKMRWGDLESYKGHQGINVVQKKTGKILWVPFTQELQEAMKLWERQPGFICLMRNGEPWTRPKLSRTWWEEVRTNPLLADLRDAGLSFHGLRLAGCSEGEIASMVGMSIPMVSRYCRRSEQKDNALAALARLDRAAEVIPLKDRR